MCGGAGAPEPLPMTTYAEPRMRLPNLLLLFTSSTPEALFILEKCRLTKLGILSFKHHSKIICAWRESLRGFASTSKAESQPRASDTEAHLHSNINISHSRSTHISWSMIHLNQSPTLHPSLPPKCPSESSLTTLPHSTQTSTTSRAA